MSKEKAITVEGTITSNLSHGFWQVTTDKGINITCTLAGKMNKDRKIIILPGDRVKVELSPYDLTKGRIVYRIKAGMAAK